MRLKNNYIYTKNFKCKNQFKQHSFLCKRTPYDILHEFKTSLINSSSKWKNSFYCKYSVSLEKILYILWDRHCINGYLKYNCKKKGDYALKVYLKTGYKGFNVVNQLFCYPAKTCVSWFELNSIVSKNASLIYILSTSLGILEGKDAVKKGIGGILIYKVIL